MPNAGVGLRHSVAQVWPGRRLSIPLQTTTLLRRAQIFPLAKRRGPVPVRTGNLRSVRMHGFTVTR